MRSIEKSGITKARLEDVNSFSNGCAYSRAAATSGNTKSAEKMNTLPEPLIHTDCDLRDFQYMELDVRRLRDSRFAAQVSGDAFRAGFLLWCASWHQVPAASLPDDDIELANLAGYGRFTKEWKKVKDEALYGFVLCSDGRWYHPVIAEKASSAWDAKRRHAYGKLIDRLRKENNRREKEGRPLVGFPPFELWNAGRYPNGIPPEPPATSGGIPPENALRGNGAEQTGEGEGEGTEQNGDLINTNTEHLAPAPHPATSDDSSLPAGAPPGPAAIPASPATSARAKPADATASPSKQTWAAYATAYEARYQVAPVRNAKVNGQISQVVARLGAEESAAVARFFVGHSNLLYFRAMHPVDLLLRDAEKLRTEWVTGRKVTHTEALQFDKTQANANAFGPMLAEAQAKQNLGGNHVQH